MDFYDNGAATALLQRSIMNKQRLLDQSAYHEDRTKTLFKRQEQMIEYQGQLMLKQEDVWMKAMERQVERLSGLRRLQSQVLKTEITELTNTAHFNDQMPPIPTKRVQEDYEESGVFSSTEASPASSRDYPKELAPKAEKNKLKRAIERVRGNSTIKEVKLLEVFDWKGVRQEINRGLRMRPSDHQSAHVYKKVKSVTIERTFSPKVLSEINLEIKKAVIKPIVYSGRKEQRFLSLSTARPSTFHEDIPTPIAVQDNRRFVDSAAQTDKAKIRDLLKSKLEARNEIPAFSKKAIIEIEVDAVSTASKIIGQADIIPARPITPNIIKVTPVVDAPQEVMKDQAEDLRPCFAYEDFDELTGEMPLVTMDEVEVDQKVQFVAKSFPLDVHVSNLKESNDERSLKLPKFESFRKEIEDIKVIANGTLEDDQSENRRILNLVNERRKEEKRKSNLVAEKPTTKTVKSPVQIESSISSSLPSFSMSSKAPNSTSLSLTLSSLPTLSEGEVLTQFYSQGEVLTRPLPTSREPGEISDPSTSSGLLNSEGAISLPDRARYSNHMDSLSFLEASNSLHTTFDELSMTFERLSGIQSNPLD